MIPVKLEDLLHTREELVRLIKENLTERERQFILSVKKSEPLWDLFELDHIRLLPAVQWKLQNISQMNSKKHEQAVEKLEKYLEL